MISPENLPQDNSSNAQQIPLNAPAIDKINTAKSPKPEILLLKLPQAQAHDEPPSQPNISTAKQAEKAGLESQIQSTTILSKAKAFWKKHLAFPELPQLPDDQPITKWEKFGRYLNQAIHIGGSTLLASSPLISALCLAASIKIAFGVGIKAAAISLIPVVATPILLAVPGAYICWRAKKLEEKDISYMLETREEYKKHGPPAPLFTKEDLNKVLETFGLRKISVPEGGKLAELNKTETFKLHAQQVLGGITFSTGLTAAVAGLGKGLLNIPFNQHLPFLQEMGKMFGSLGYMFSGAIIATILTSTGANLARSAWKKHFSVLPEKKASS